MPANLGKHVLHVLLARLDFFQARLPRGFERGSSRASGPGTERQKRSGAAAMGFCYGGPYAILGPARLGYDAGIGCHSTQMKDFIGDLEGVARPVCLLWGDKDQMAPPELLEIGRASCRERV